jgi:hypothetical protein
MRLISCRQGLKTKQHQSKSNPYFGQWMTKASQLTALSVVITGFCLFIPQMVQAETARIDDVTIDRQPDETYDSLIQRAESAARTAVEQSFARSSQITDVSVVILGQNQGVIAPVLAIGVSRPQWNSGGNEFTYFNSARSLLRLDQQQLATTDSPQQQGNTPPVPPRPRQTSPGSSRQIINNTPTQRVNSAPGVATPPGSPTLVPRPQSPGITPVTSPGSSQNSGSNSGNTSPSVAPTTSPGNNQNSGNNFGNTSPSVVPTTSPGNSQNSGNNSRNTSPSVAPLTAPASGNSPQINPANSTPN